MGLNLGLEDGVDFYFEVETLKNYTDFCPTMSWSKDEKGFQSAS